MTSPEPLKLAAVLVRNERASDTVNALCNGTERWVIRVPAQPDRDPDLVISASLNDVPALVAELRRARDDAAELRAAAADAAALLKRIDDWEGSVILADEVWATSDGMPKLTRELYDQWIELQDERNRVRAALAASEGEEA